MTPEYKTFDFNEYESSKAIQLIDSIAKQYNLTFLNYNLNYYDSTFCRNKEYFEDWGHMSKKGSEVFSEKLKNDLKSLK